MGLPVAGADLVADQGIARLVVGNAQQRLGQAHQRHALLAGQRVFVDQGLDSAAAPGLFVQPLDQPARQGGGPFGDLARQGGLLDQRRQAFRFGPPVSRRDRGPQRALGLNRLREIAKRRCGHVGQRWVRMTGKTSAQGWKQS